MMSSETVQKAYLQNEVVTLDKPAMAGDDFSYFGENVPSAILNSGW